MDKDERIRLIAIFLKNYRNDPVTRQEFDKIKNGMYVVACGDSDPLLTVNLPLTIQDTRLINITFRFAEAMIEEYFEFQEEKNAKNE